MKSKHLKFYEVDKNYVTYLKQFESKIPNLDYDKYDKFFCGVVLRVEDHKYFVPVSSQKKKTATSFLIHGAENRILGSLRFSFMFPVPDGYFFEKDFSKYDLQYRNLVDRERRYCNKNKEQIFKQAKRVYNLATNGPSYMRDKCCNYKLLEQKAKDWERTQERVRDHIDSQEQSVICESSIKKAIEKEFNDEVKSELPGLKELMEELEEEPTLKEGLSREPADHRINQEASEPAPQSETDNDIDR